MSPKNSLTAAPLDETYIDKISLQAMFNKYVYLDPDRLECGLHALHVQLLTKVLAKHLLKVTDKYKLKSSDVHYISVAASLHDIGKAYIPANVINNDDALTKEEYDLIKTHPMVGVAVLDSAVEIKDKKLVKYGKQVCRWHHERWDGNGYPDKLSGEQIPIAAQLVSLADCYDAITSDRSYHSKVSHDRAVVMIISGECGSFNPLLLECLVDASDELREVHGSAVVNKLSAEEIINMLLELSDKKL